MRNSKKHRHLESINRKALASRQGPPAVMIVRVETEMAERWSFVQSKQPQRWLWHAINHHSSEILADVLVPHEETALSALMELLHPFGIQQFYTGNWGADSRQLDSQPHTIGKTNTQKIERQHLTLRTRIKRLTRKTICFSKSVLMHDTVIGLFINRYEFGRPI